MFEEEKLIEELDNIMYSEFAVSYPPWSELGHEDLARSMITWRKVITRIGRAVLSGECPDLDKSLGVVGRKSILDLLNPGTTAAWVGTMLAKSAVEAIALRNEKKEKN